MECSWSAHGKIMTETVDVDDFGAGTENSNFTWEQDGEECRRQSEIHQDTSAASTCSMQGAAQTGNSTASETREQTTTADSENIDPSETPNETPVLEAYLIDRNLIDTRREDDTLVVSGVVEDKSEASRQTTIFVVGTCFLVVLGILIGGILIGRKLRKDDSTELTFAPTTAPTEAGDPLDVLAVLGPLVGNETTIPLDTTNSLERAFRWITEVDQSGIVDDPRAPEWKLVQRFALVVLYYATDGANWRNQLSFLSDKDECEWFENTRYISEDFERVWRNRVNERNLLLYDPLVDLLGRFEKTNQTLTGGTVPYCDNEDFTSHWIERATEESIFGNPFDELFDRFGVTNETSSDNGVRTCDAGGRVTAINIPGNNLRGTLPEVLSVLEGLEYLEFLGNFDLGGTLPAGLGNLRRLKTLNLAYNAFSGTLPPEYSQMTNITGVFLPLNFVHGSLPSKYSALRDLKNFDVSGNGLEGSLPKTYSSWTLLETIDVSGNLLTGTLPRELLGWTRLRFIDFSFNALSGSLPSEFSNWTDLKYSDFDFNALSGTFPCDDSSSAEAAVDNQGATLTECPGATAIPNIAAQSIVGDALGQESVLFTIIGSGDFFYAYACGDGSGSNPFVIMEILVLEGSCDLDANPVGTYNDVSSRSCFVEWFAEEGAVYHIKLVGTAGDTGNFELLVFPGSES